MLGRQRPQIPTLIEMKFQGHQQTEIARELGISAPAVCLRLRAMRRRWDAQDVA